MPRLQTNILRVLRSERFFKAIMALFVLESVWIAISAAYPMVFDENVHLGVIQLYAQQWSPFFPEHFTYTEPVGALVRDPSFLYRYLLSFPYRLVRAVTSDQMTQIIDLRFVNIFLFGGALVLYRRLLLKTRVSPGLVHAALLLFVLVPVVPLLAGQINYDNMVILVTAGTLLAAVSVGQRLGKPGQIPAGGILWLVTLCLLGSLVQFEFLPVFAAVMLWIGWKLWREVRAGRLQLLPALRQAWAGASWRRKLAVALPLAIALWLFLQLYGVNLWRYHTITPTCGQVLTAQQCSTDANWLRSQQALAHRADANTNPLLFAGSWTYRMFIGMFYTSSGGASAQAWYLSINPLPVIFVTALATSAAGMLLFIRYWRSILSRYDYLGFLLLVSLTYIGSLWLHNYLEFVRYGQKFAINGRYLFPVALPCLVLAGLGFKQLLGQRERLKIAALVVVFVLFLQGGGALTYITVSNRYWYWPNQTAVTMNRWTQRFVRPLMLIKTPVPNLGRLSGR